MPKKLPKQKTLFEKMNIDPFVLVVALVLLFIASVLVFPNLSLSQKLFSANNTNSSVATPIPLKGAALEEKENYVQLEQGERELQAACVADLQGHGVTDGDHFSHCLIDYKEELETRSKTYGDECNSHDECPPSIVWTQDAHHGECPAGTNFKCSLRCTSDDDCSFKTGGVLSSCCFACSGSQPFGFCVG